MSRASIKFNFNLWSRAILISALLLSALLSFGQGTEYGIVRPASDRLHSRQQKVTQEQWLSLIQWHLSKMPELQQIWSGRRTMQVKGQISSSQDFYIGGGLLRGLIFWLEDQLEEQTFEKIKNIQSPRISDLILAEADKDIFIKGIDPFLLSHEIDVTGWDLIRDQDLSESLKAGGSGIEKVGVNPEIIYDPLGALEKYYLGSLVYLNSSDADFVELRKRDENHSSGGFHGNSKIALVLRHLRFIVLFSDVALTNEEKQELKKVVQLEIPSLSTHNYWIEQTLRKLELELQKKWQDAAKEKLLSLLDEMDLLLPLAIYGYKTYDKVKLFDLPMFHDYLRHEHYELAINVKGHSYSEQVVERATEVALSASVSTLEYMQALSPIIKQPKEKFRRTFEQIIERHSSDHHSFPVNEEEIKSLKQKLKPSCGGQLTV